MDARRKEKEQPKDCVMALGTINLNFLIMGWCMCYTTRWKIFIFFRSEHTNWAFHFAQESKANFYLTSLEDKP